MSGPALAMLLAAGRGTRMGALTAARPKPLVEVGGQALIDHALDRLAAAGVRRVVVNLHYLGGMIRAHLAGRASPEIVFSEEEALLETGGGMRLARPLLGREPVFALNADAIWAGADPLASLTGAWDGARMGALLHLARREDALGHKGPGDFFRDGEGRLARRGAAEAAPFVFTGAEIIDPGALDDTPEGPFSLNLVWDRLIAEGRLFGVVHEGRWADVGSPEGIGLAEGLLR
ncbi:MAG: nucleotidyltransferase family protein [Pikeienuella sp.]|uniref:nucleotidyltransferase family protein n=1 Tax=Pikeienuella sp. TaxID=2831957 RepID=UPI00391D64FA